MRLQHISHRARGPQDALQQVEAGHLGAVPPQSALERPYLRSIPKLELCDMVCNEQSTMSHTSTNPFAAAFHGGLASTSRRLAGIEGSSWVSREFRESASIVRRDKASVRGVEAALATARTTSAVHTGGLMQSPVDSSSVHCHPHTGASVPSQEATGGHTPAGAGEHSGCLLYTSPSPRD